MKGLIKTLTAAAALWVSTQASAAPLQALGPAAPTSAWSEFCHRQPHECVVNPKEASVVPNTPEVRAILDRVNREVNAQIRPMTDQDHIGVVDRWDYPVDGIGDCEDIQLVKRHRLIQLGFPRRALRMTVVIDEQGEGHAVLTVHTSTEDLILDNKHNAVLPWHKTGYIFIKRESRTGPGWEALGGVVGSVPRTASSEGH